jgi:hypothetical protein
MPGEARSLSRWPGHCPRHNSCHQSRQHHPLRANTSSPRRWQFPPRSRRDGPGEAKVVGGCALLTALAASLPPRLQGPHDHVVAANGA